MTLYVVRGADVAAGDDFRFVVPGNYLYDVTGITATLSTGTAPFAVLQDSSGNGNDGTYSATLSGFPAFVPGLVAGDLAVQWGFEPAGGDFSHATPPGTLLDWAGIFSIEGWLAQDAANLAGGSLFVASNLAGHEAISVTSDPATSQHIVVGRNRPQELTVSTNGTFPCDSAGHHVVVTFDGTTMRIYIDGAAVTLSVNDPHVAQTVVATRCALSGNGLGGNGSSLISDEVAIYNHVLTPARIAAHHTAAAVSFAAYSAAVLADTPTAYYHLNDAGAGTGRQPTLVVGDGTTELEAIPTGFPAVATPGPYDYAWQPRLNADTQSTDGTLTTVAIPRLLLPAGYVVGARTLDLQPGDQWSNVTLWWDDAYQEAVNPSQPWEYPPGALLKFVQSGG